MSAVADTAEITYKVPRRRHPVLAFTLQQPLGAAGLAIIVLMLAGRGVRADGSRPTTR